MTRPRIVSWFSCGTASAVSTKLVIAAYGATHDIAVARCIVPEEHSDNDRFAADCATWFGQPVIALRSADYASCEDVWTKRRFMSGPHGAPCTIEMKKAVRWAFEADWQPNLQAFGYTADETDRADRFRAQNPDVSLVTPLIERGLSKPDCHAIIDRAGIVIPEMYRLGFNNANCIGCVKGGEGYWNKVRTVFPIVFEQMAALQEDIGPGAYTFRNRDTGVRFGLRQLDPAAGRHDEQLPSCSFFCDMAEQDIAHA